MIAVTTELEALLELATTLNRLPGVSRRDPEAWHLARDQIARAIARSVGRIRAELGITAPRPATSFHAAHGDCGFFALVRANGRVIPIERRSLSRPHSRSEK